MVDIDIPGTTLKRNMNSKALVERNHVLVDDYNIRRKTMKSVQTGEQRINILESEITGIKSMLNLILEKLDNR